MVKTRIKMLCKNYIEWSWIRFCCCPIFCTTWCRYFLTAKRVTFHFIFFHPCIDSLCHAILCCSFCLASYAIMTPQIKMAIWIQEIEISRTRYNLNSANEVDRKYIVSSFVTWFCSLEMHWNFQSNEYSIKRWIWAKGRLHILLLVLITNISIRLLSPDYDVLEF